MPNDADALTDPDIEGRQVDEEPPTSAEAAADDRAFDADLAEAFDTHVDDGDLDDIDALDDDDGLLFDGDPDEFDLGFGPEPAPPIPYPDGLPHVGPPDVGARVAGPAMAGAPMVRRPIHMSRAERRRRVRLQARRVRRIVRHVEPWSVLKMSLLFYACLWGIFLVAGIMIWGVAESSGTIGKLESLVTDLFKFTEFTIDAGQIFRAYSLGGLALAIAGTTFNVLMCLLFNLISDLTGGLRITMIEEETARPVAPRRRRRRVPPTR